MARHSRVDGAGWRDNRRRQRDGPNHCRRSRGSQIPPGRRKHTRANARHYHRYARRSYLSPIANNTTRGKSHTHRAETLIRDHRTHLLCDSLESPCALESRDQRRGNQPGGRRGSRVLQARDGDTNAYQMSRNVYQVRRKNRNHRVL